MYVLAVVALLETGTMMSLDQFELYNTQTACQANTEQAMYDLAQVLIADGHKIKTVNVSCLPVIPALEKNPYEKGA